MKQEINTKEGNTVTKNIVVEGRFINSERATRGYSPLGLVSSNFEKTFDGVALHIDTSDQVEEVFFPRELSEIEIAAMRTGKIRYEMNEKNWSESFVDHLRSIKYIIQVKQSEEDEGTKIEFSFNV